MRKNALIVVTSNDELGTSGEKTGWYLSEVSKVYWPLANAGFKVEFASPKGLDAPVEDKSMKLDDPENRDFVNKFDIKMGIRTKAIKDIDPQNFDVIYFAGGHGTMWDFPDNPDIERVTRAIWENDGIVAAVCHGPSALTSVKLSDGSYLIEGKEINSFTDSEEREAGKDKIVPFLLESRLRERGAIFKPGKNGANQVVIDGRLVTGQNPQSASSLGKAIVEVFERLHQDANQSEKSSDRDQASLQ